MSLLPHANSDVKYTYADYLTWPDDERWEILDGVAYSMSPAPTTNHQRVLRKLAFGINVHLEGKRCELFLAPFDVRLCQDKQQSDNYIETVVQPDILVVCDPSKIDRSGCIGAPDLVVEILSPSTASNDLKYKFELYQRFGVKEYWIIHPEEQTLLVYKLGGDGMYGAADRYAGDDKVAVPLLGDLVVDLGVVFVE